MPSSPQRCVPRQVSTLSVRSPRAAANCSHRAATCAASGSTASAPMHTCARTAAGARTHTT
eukprot:1440141-Alexandrium_andersonii.AAC.1